MEAVLRAKFLANFKCTLFRVPSPISQFYRKEHFYSGSERDTPLSFLRSDQPFTVPDRMLVLSRISQYCNFETYFCA